MRRMMAAKSGGGGCRKRMRQQLTPTGRLGAPSVPAPVKLRSTVSGEKTAIRPEQSLSSITGIDPGRGGGVCARAIVRGGAYNAHVACCIGTSSPALMEGQS